MRNPMSPRTAIPASLAVLAALLLMPAAASAAPSSVELSGILAVGPEASDGTPHLIDVSFTDGVYVVTDSAGAVAGSSCTQVSSTSVSCLSGGVTGVAIGGGAAADRLTIASTGPDATGSGIFGFGGNDTITTPDFTQPAPDPDSPCQARCVHNLIRGGEGNDTIVDGPAPDDIKGGPGSDTVSFANRPASQPVRVTLDGDPDNEQHDGANGGAENDFIEVENLIGTPGDDVLAAGSYSPFEESSLANRFAGGGGNDLLVGGFGADRLLGQAGNDRLLGGGQKDNLIGGANRDRCVGGASKDHAKQCERKASI
jgi:Ca2+-binding RTX toxin-like protein